VALDIRQDKLRFLSRSNPRRLQADITRLPLQSGSVEAAVLSQSLEYVPELSTALREVNRVLKPGGIAVFSVVDSRRLGWRLLGALYRLLPNVKKGPQKHHQLSRSLFVDQIAAHGFRALKYRYIFGSELILKAQKVE
jgi:ubiquinone/menaquinone biosynthesis C-methylase UbiE